MKKKSFLILVFIAAAVFFSSCEKIFGEDDAPEDDYENYAHYELFINTIDHNKVGYLSYSVIADPPTDLIEVDIGYPNEDYSTTENFQLPLDIYEGKTVTVIVYASRCNSGSECQQSKEIVVENSDHAKSLFFGF